MKKLIPLLFAALVLASCEKDATIDVPKVDPTLGVAGFLSPGEPIEITLTEVSPIFGGDLGFFPNSISTAAVFLSNGQDTVQLVHQQDRYVDQSGLFQIEAGRTYWFWASAEGYPPVKASTSVPSYQVPPYDVLFETSYNGFDSIFGVQLTWQDAPGQDNFYRIQADLIDSMNGNLFQAVPLIYNDHAYVNDFGNDGQLLTNVPGGYQLGSQGGAWNRYIDSYILCSDRAYFEYHRDLVNYEEDNPFAEPIELFSNIEGGSGILGSYLITRQIKKIF